ncbi:flagellar protein FliJ [Bacillus sp. JCM 19046]|nr:flagellar export protein FliJ [Shouchella xiaoxiensis]GAF12882.1 flagellar protein FliJ [Bacillus sp. JCM 19045]GAF16751.1 flagellar protein FliJ [Bacillus sp. JCM 19046]
MSFTFSLQEAMDMSKREKELAKKELDQAEGEFKEKATALYNLLIEKEGLETEQATVLQRKTTVLSLSSYENYLQALETKLMENKQQTDQARDRMQIKQTYFNECAKAYKQYERLKEKKRIEADQLEKQLEQKQMDEVSITRYRRVLV